MADARKRMMGGIALAVSDQGTEHDEECSASSLALTRGETPIREALARMVLERQGDSQ